LRQAAKQGLQTVSSADIEQRTGISSGQVRKDLSYFGEFGKPGLGYAVGPLLARLSAIMRLDREQKVIIVGGGNLGSALAGYVGLGESGFRVAGIFDKDQRKIGKKLWQLEIKDTAQLASFNSEAGVEIGVIATPASTAQEVCELMAKAGVKAILNFAPVRLKPPAGVVVRNVDLTQELEVLSYLVPRETG
jgi:redox-sensing transcriptional repressor